MTVLSLATHRRRILARNHLEYDDADDVYWRRTVYEAVHDGWSFASIGGRHVLDALCEAVALGPESRVFELCCGLGDTCAYLAAARGCRVTGVEVNANQVDQARRRLRRRGIRGVTIVHGDALGWRPGHPYDAGACIDSLMLLEEPGRALQTAQQALAPEGALVVADVLAGRSVTAAVRRFTWREDGILNLFTAEEHDGLLREAGLVEIARTDRTDLAVRCFERMVAASAAHQHELVAAKGAVRYARWIGNARRYLELFRSGALTYTVAVGRRRPARRRAAAAGDPAGDAQAGRSTAPPADL